MTAQQQIAENTYYYDVTEERPLVSENYPWGYRLRTTQRYWVESNLKLGQRFVTQTLNPKTNKWCNPKKSTYSIRINTNY